MQQLAIYKHRNGGGRRVPIRNVLTSAAFRRGFEDAKAGRPYDPEAFPAKPSKKPGQAWQANEQWCYERGRQFAMIWPKRHYMRGCVLLNEALYAYADARATRAIV